MVRWVDFVPAADEALKKQAVEAGKALGAEITLETINANDIQPRITAAISSGAARTSSSSSTTSPTSTRRAWSTSATSWTPIGKEQGGYYPAAEGLAKVNGRLARRAARRGRRA